MTGTDDPASEVELRDLLVEENCDGARWRRFAETLAEYGYAVVMAWLRSEAIFGMCAERGYALREPPTAWEYDDLVSMATDTVVKAISDFRRKALLDGGWRPDGGASLKSYFVTGCVLAFPNVYRKWRRQFDQRGEEFARSVLVDDLTEVTSRSPDPGDVAIARLEIRRGLAGIGDERTRRAVILREAGYTVGEIAETLGTSHGTIKGALERLRRNTGGSTRSGGGNA
ncbi:hypothetical protein AB0I60_17140 [Actinosynnema sp. NPDC050436]|uniref:RNA polymerase sigma factor n=1 Tax=Actinosynnema sp. NPDC050436 TaxID=3155659 RepID=UPI00340E20C7